MKFKSTVADEKEYINTSVDTKKTAKKKQVKSNAKFSYHQQMLKLQKKRLIRIEDTEKRNQDFLTNSIEKKGWFNEREHDR